MHLATNRINHVDANMVSLYAVICFLPSDPHALPLCVQLWNMLDGPQQVEHDNFEFLVCEKTISSGKLYVGFHDEWQLAYWLGRCKGRRMVDELSQVKRFKTSHYSIIYNQTVRVADSILKNRPTIDFIGFPLFKYKWIDGFTHNSSRRAAAAVKHTYQTLELKLFTRLMAYSC